MYVCICVYMYVYMCVQACTCVCVVVFCLFVCFYLFNGVSEQNKTKNADFAPVTLTSECHQ